MIDDEQLIIYNKDTNDVIFWCWFSGEFDEDLIVDKNYAVAFVDSKNKSVVCKERLDNGIDAIKYGGSNA